MTETSGVLVVGSANQDIVVGVDRLPLLGETILGSGVAYLPGGKGLNQACASAMTGTPTHFVGAVGDDEAGAHLLAAMMARGVDVSLTPLLEGIPSGTAHILVSRDGGNQIVVVPSANSEVAVESVRDAFAALPAANVLVLQGEIPFNVCLAAAELMEARGGRVVFNLAPAAQVPAELLSLADPLVVNEFEAGIVLGRPAPTSVREGAQAAEDLLDHCRSVIVTLGGDGSAIAYPGGAAVIEATKVDEVVDTTGAGDAFVGVLAAELSKGSGLEEAPRLASRSAAATVTLPGASQSYDAIGLLYKR